MFENYRVGNSEIIYIFVFKRHAAWTYGEPGAECYVEPKHKHNNKK
jgi:hypothetical protein